MKGGAQKNEHQVQKQKAEDGSRIETTLLIYICVHYAIVFSKDTN